MLAFLTRILLAMHSVLESGASREAEILVLRQQLMVVPGQKFVRVTEPAGCATQDAGGFGSTSTPGTLLFFDPPNREIVERFRQIERATERRMVAVHKVVFLEDAEPEAIAR